MIKVHKPCRNIKIVNKTVRHFSTPLSSTLVLGLLIFFSNVTSKFELRTQCFELTFIINYIRQFHDFDLPASINLVVQSVCSFVPDDWPWIPNYRCIPMIFEY